MRNIGNQRLNGLLPMIHVCGDMEMVPQISSTIMLAILRSVCIGSFDGTSYGPPHEKCGILRGRGNRITEAMSARNVSPTPTTAFEIDPAALIRAHQLARRRGGLAIFGYFHTHPVGDASPSSRDAAGAMPDGLLWLIASRTEAKLWRAVDNGVVHGRFDPVVFDLKVGNRCAQRVGGVTLR